MEDNGQGPRAVILLVLRLVIVMLVVAGVGLGGYYAWQQWSQKQQELNAALNIIEQAKGEQDHLQDSLKETEAQLAQENETLQERIQALSGENDDLQEKLASLSSVAEDRDNLLAQVKKLQDEVKEYQDLIGRQKQVNAERDLLEQLLKRSADENRSLRDEIPMFQQQLVELQSDREDLIVQHNSLKQKLSELKDDSKVFDLEEKLSSRSKENDELTNVIDALNREVGELEKREATVRGRLGDMQQDYASVVKENNQLRTQMKTVPEEFSVLARQHESLVKEAADMHYNLGVLFVRDAQHERAAKEFLKVLELRPDDADTYYNLGIIYSKHIPDREKAIAYFRKYLEFKPNAKDAGWVRQYIASWQAWNAEERLE